MRAVAEATFFSSIFLLMFFAHSAIGEPQGDSEISFSVPFICDTDGGSGTRCLANALKPGLSTVLLSEKGVCTAKTAEVFTYHQLAGDFDFEATRLSGHEECFTIGENEGFTNFRMAVVGADPRSVRLISPISDSSPVPKKIELRARKLAVPWKDDAARREVSVRVSDTLPKVIRVADITLLAFDLEQDGRPWAPGPTVLLKNGKVFVLKGACTYHEPIFFSVNDKLYLTYVATVHCCECGDANFFVYDLSGAAPEMVYVNSNFSD